MSQESAKMEPVASPGSILANATTSAGQLAGQEALGMQTLVTAAAVASLIVLLSIASLPHLKRFLEIQKLPRPKDTPLLLGNIGPLLKPNHHLAFREWGKELGGIFRLRLLTVHIIAIVDARWVNVVLGAGEGLNKGYEPDNANPMISVTGHRTLFTADTNSKYWRLIRKGTTPAFQFKNIRKGFPEVLKMAEQLVHHIKQLGPNGDFDINNLTMRYSMDVTGLVGFAKDFGTCRTFDDASTDELFDILRAGMLECYSRAINPFRRLMIWNPEVRAGQGLFTAYQARMRELVMEVKARGPPAAEDVSIAAHLLRLKDPDTGVPLSDDLLTGEFGVYFAAGIESAGNAMSWTLMMISERPDVEAKICAELDAIGVLATPERPNPRPIELVDLNSLKYFDNVCKEAMRIKPVASTGTTRKIKRDLYFDKYKVPAGSIIVCPFDAIHHNPLNWEDPDEFLPERWDRAGTEFIGSSGSKDQAGEERAKRYLPFSTGPRQCIGQSLAHMMHDVGVAVLLSHFHFQLAPKMGGMEGVLKTEINRLTLQPGIGLWMNAIPRASTAALL